MEQFIIQVEDAGNRLDVFLHTRFPTIARNSFKNLITAKQITINYKPTKPSYMLKVGDICTINFESRAPLKNQEAVQKIDIPVIFEHEQFIIINKPAGILVQEVAHNKDLLTVADWLLAHYPDIKNIGSQDRPGIVHRLDKDTSGIMLIAKTEYAYTYFLNQFKERKVKKTYSAVAEGALEQTARHYYFSHNARF